MIACTLFIAGQDTIQLDECCPQVKVDGDRYQLIYPNNTNGLANVCKSSCPYLLNGAEDRLNARCFNTVTNKDLCLFPRPLQRNRKIQSINMDKTKQPKTKQGSGSPRICGWVYTDAWYRGLKGWAQESEPHPVMSGNLNNKFNNKISSLKVANGCEMHLFRNFNHEGTHVTYSRNKPWVGWSNNDVFSSYMCTCSKYCSKVTIFCTNSSFPM